MNKNKKTKLIILSAIIFAFVSGVFPSVSDAALVPCGTSANPETCTLCHLVQGIHNIIEWGRNIAFVVGIFVITISGILYLVSAGDSGLIEKAKSGIKYSLIGFALLLSSWVLVNQAIRIMGAESSFKDAIGGNWWSMNITCSPGAIVHPGAVLTGNAGGLSAADLAQMSHASVGTSGCARGICHDNTELEEVNSWENYYTELGTCSYFDATGVNEFNGKCLIPKIAAGAACTGEYVDPLGTNSNPNVSGSCVQQSSCDSPLAINPDNGNNRQECVSGYVCCAPEDVSQPAGPVTGCTNSVQCNNAYTRCPTHNWSSTKCTDCIDCVDVSNVKPSWNSNTSVAKLNSSFYSQIQPFLAANDNLWLTEVWPPSQGHATAGHANGTAADISFRGGSSAYYSSPGVFDLAKINAVCDSAAASGLSSSKFYFEANTSRPAGLSQNCGYHGPGYSPHFHVQ